MWQVLWALINAELAVWPVRMGIATLIVLNTLYVLFGAVCVSTVLYQEFLSLALLNTLP